MKNPEAAWRQNARLKLEQLSIEAGASIGGFRSALDGVNEALYRRRDAERRVHYLERQNLVTGGRLKAALDDAQVQLADAGAIHSLLQTKYDRLDQTSNPAGTLFHKAESIARVLGVTK